MDRVLHPYEGDLTNSAVLNNFENQPGQFEQAIEMLCEVAPNDLTFVKS